MTLAFVFIKIKYLLRMTLLLLGFVKLHQSLGIFSRRQIDNIFHLFPQEMVFEIVCKLSPQVGMKCQSRKEGNDQESIQLSHTSHQSKGKKQKHEITGP